MLPEVKKILYATDLSDNAKVAMGWAMSLANHYDATITTLHVMPDMVEEMSLAMGYAAATDFVSRSLKEYNKEKGDELHKTIVDKIKSACSEVHGDDLGACRLDLNNVIIKTGHPVKVIVAEATEGDYDLVVMGRRGRGIIDDVLLGSVARGVVQKCPKPVLTIRYSG
ncbi:MAG TPA: universal stress protein, partial [Desulfobulbus sp.]|nr:universal stress protein [Desulfobulbus sp.]